jgi:hypothetical protein
MMFKRSEEVENRRNLLLFLRGQGTSDEFRRFAGYATIPKLVINHKSWRRKRAS